MDADMQIDSTINKLADQYASCDRRSADINEERATIRENAEKLGIPSKAFQHAVNMVKQMSEGERRDYQVGVNRVLKVISDRQGELYPQEAAKALKREAERAASTKEGDAKSDANPRSNPKSGGAGKVVPIKPKAAPDIVASAPLPPAAAAKEQAEGEKVLASAIPPATPAAPAGGPSEPPEPPAGNPWPDDLQAAKKGETVN